MHRDAGEWRHVGGISPTVLSKVGQYDRRCLFIIGVAPGKFDGGAKDLFPNFPKHARKGFCATFAYKILSHKDNYDLFLV